MNLALLRIILILSFAAGVVYYVHVESGSDPIALGAAIAAWIFLALSLLNNYKKKIKKK